MGGVGDVTRTICESAEYIESKIMIVLADLAQTGKLTSLDGL